MTTNQFPYKKITDLRFEDRPREKFNSLGKEYLTSTELLAVLLGSGTKRNSVLDISTQIFDFVQGDLTALSRLKLIDFKGFKGIGNAKAILFVAALELGKRIAQFESKNMIQQIQSSSDAFQLVRPLFQELIHEEFWVIYLNRASKVIRMEQLSKGGVSGTAVDVKLILKNALSYVASSMIIVHNHPSGNLTPSEADRQITKKIVEAGKIMDVCLVDHLIIGDNKYVSFADEGWI